MRVTSDIFVSALVRRVFGQGGFAAIVRRGATEAGAIFVVTRGRLGTATLFGPAPQTAYDGERPDERRFALLLADAEEAAVEARIAKETRFDSDIWVVEIEPAGTAVEALISVAPTEDD
jgi:hypothetical protein